MSQSQALDNAEPQALPQQQRVEVENVDAGLSLI